MATALLCSEALEHLSKQTLQHPALSKWFPHPSQRKFSCRSVPQNHLGGLLLPKTFWLYKYR